MIGPQRMGLNWAEWMEGEYHSIQFIPVWQATAEWIKFQAKFSHTIHSIDLQWLNG